MTEAPLEPEPKAAVTLPTKSDTERGAAAPETVRRSWPERARVPTSRPEPCVFAGTLEFELATLSSDPGFASPVLEFSRLDIARLTLAAHRGGAAELATSWPIVGTYFLDPSTLPFELASREDLVKGRIWLPAGTRVSAAERQRGSARVERPPAVGGRSRSTPIFNRLLRCESLILASVRVFEDEAEPSDTDDAEWRLYEGAVSLSPSPGSAPFGKLELDVSGASFESWRSAEGWTRIAGEPDDTHEWYVPYAFDAWTKSTSDEGGYGMGGLGMGPPEPTHVTISSVPLYGAALGRKPIAVLAPEVPLAAGER